MDGRRRDGQAWQSRGQPSGENKLTSKLRGRCRVGGTHYRIGIESSLMYRIDSASDVGPLLTFARVGQCASGCTDDDDERRN